MEQTWSSLSGAPCEAEPLDTIGHMTPRASNIVRNSSISSISRSIKTPRASSATSSPLPSRETSPIRSNPKGNAPSRSTVRPRKNSSQDVSPARSANTSANPLSSATTQRTLSAAAIPTLHPVASQETTKISVPQKPSSSSEPKETPRWPISPRLRSPPPISKHSILSPRKTDQDLPSINVQRTIPLAEEGKTLVDHEGDETLTIPGMRTPARGVSGASSTLETVQEISQPNTPAATLDGALEKLESDVSWPGAEPESTVENSNKAMPSKPSLLANESGSESGGRGEIKLRTTTSGVLQSAPPRSNGLPVKSFSTGGLGRGKPSGEGSTRNMTVETETVSSIPQVAVGTGGPGNNGSLRTKPSSETIRPKNEKKKTARKAPSVTSGTDIFEAKVASAVDEANSSDSEETFVYESNPPDAADRPRRFHSRTPSATSMASQADQRSGARAVLDGHHSVAMKKSMKFANSYNSAGPESTYAEDDGKGTIRSSMGTGRGTTHHHHMGGRWGRNGGNGHPSLFDNESPFPHAAKSKLSGVRQSSRPTSPRIPNMRMAVNGKRSSPMPASYDLDDGADDERTPLISTIRSGRSGRARRPIGSIRQLEHQASRQSRSFLARFTGCLVLSLMIIFVVAGAIGFMYATTQPLDSVKVLALKSVLASEQDVIFDISVQALNRNIVVVTIDATDLVVFAKSKYAGTNSEYWKHPQPTRKIHHTLGYFDDDTPDDDPETSPNLEIGHVTTLDSPLTFEGSPFHNDFTVSTGQISIKHPGNSTMPAGSERWGRVLQHEFELIIRGTLKYTLPLNQKLRRVKVDGRVTVKPNAADRDPDEAFHIYS